MPPAMGIQAELNVHQCGKEKMKLKHNDNLKPLRKTSKKDLSKNSPYSMPFRPEK